MQNTLLHLIVCIIHIPLSQFMSIRILLNSFISKTMIMPGFSLSFLSHKASQITRTSVTSKNQSPSISPLIQLCISWMLAAQIARTSFCGLRSHCCPLHSPTQSVILLSGVLTSTRDPFPVNLLKNKNTNKRQTEQGRKNRNKEGY